ncbi:hypothetical protein [Micromonospora zhanjiangensis]
MGRRFEEIDWRETPIGAISLRRRLDPALDVDVYEVKLDDEYLMSSLFTVAEVELARLALAELPGADLDVAVGGLGLGHTAAAVLDDRRVRTLTVIEALDEVISWHRRGLLPLASRLTGDPRSRLVRGTSSPRSTTPPVSTRRRPAGASTRSWWTSTTLRDTSCTPATPRSTPPPVCTGSPAGSGPAGCSPSGPTTRPTTGSPAPSPRCSGPYGPTSSPSPTT